MPNQDRNCPSRIVLRKSAVVRIEFESLSGRATMKTLKSATRPRHSRIGIAIAAALGLFSGQGLAQATPAAQPARQATGDAASDQPAAKVTELKTVLVTANKRVENVRDVASSISVIAAATKSSEGTHA